MICLFFRALCGSREKGSDIFRTQGRSSSLLLTGREVCGAPFALKDWAHTEIRDQVFRFFSPNETSSGCFNYQCNWTHHTAHPIHTLRSLGAHDRNHSQHEEVFSDMKLFLPSLSGGQGAWRMARAIRVTPCSCLNALE